MLTESMLPKESLLELELALLRALQIPLAALPVSSDKGIKASAYEFRRDQMRIKCN